MSLARSSSIVTKSKKGQRKTSTRSETGISVAARSPIRPQQYMYEEEMEGNYDLW